MIDPEFNDDYDIDTDTRERCSMCNGKGWHHGEVDDPWEPCFECNKTGFEVIE